VLSDVEVILTFITDMRRGFGIPIPIPILDSSINTNELRVKSVQEERDDRCHKGETIIQPLEYELARNAINSTEPLAGNRLVGGCYKAKEIPDQGRHDLLIVIAR
jgi:hypothetical protein